MNSERKILVDRELLQNLASFCSDSRSYNEAMRVLAQPIVSSLMPTATDPDSAALNRAWQDGRAMVPDGWLVEKMADNGVSGFIVRTPRTEGVRTCTAVFPDDDDPAHRLLAMLLASPAAKDGEAKP